MRSKGILFGLVLGQLLIIGGMIGLGLRPLLTGQPVELRVEARDPRDIFRGDYVVLNYAFNTLSLDSLPHTLDRSKTYRYGDNLWVALEKKDGFYEPAKVYSFRPVGESRPVLKATVQYPVRLDNPDGGDWLYLTAGIESFYTDPQEAKALERQLQFFPDSVASRPLVTATVMVAPDGEARIKEVRVREE